LVLFDEEIYAEFQRRIAFAKNHLAHRLTAVGKDVVPIASPGENDSE